MKHPITSIFICAGLLFVSGVSAKVALPDHLIQPSSEGANEVYEEKPTTSIVGEFRTSVASYLYGKAHEYMHGGVVFRAATDTEVANGRRTASHGDSLEAHHGSQETTVIPEQEFDPRSLWGELDRGTQPWMDIRQHGHRDLSEALPLFRMMTWADPHFIEGYEMGSYLVFSSATNKRVDRAMKFLEEGIANNPGSYRLHKSYGHYALTITKQNELALEHLEKAVSIIEARQLAKRTQRNDSMTEGQQRVAQIEDLEQSQAWNEFIQVLRKLERKEEAIRWSKRCIEVNAPCPSGRRALEVYGVKP